MDFTGFACGLLLLLLRMLLPCFEWMLHVAAGRQQFVRAAGAFSCN